MISRSLKAVISRVKLLTAPARTALLVAVLTYSGMRLWSAASATRRDQPRGPSPTGTLTSVNDRLVDPWRLAFVRYDVDWVANVWVANGDGSAERLLVRNAEAPCWSPNKRQIAFVRDGNVWVANADGSAQRQLSWNWPAGPSPCVYWGGRSIGITWSRSNGMIYAHADRARVLTSEEGRRGLMVSRYSLFDARSLGTDAIILNANHPAWSPSGRYLAFTRDRDIVYDDIWIAQTRKQAEHSRGGVKGFVVRRLAWGVKDRSYDPPSTGSSYYAMAVSHLSWSPDERRLAYSVECVNHGTRESSGIYLLELARVKENLVVKQRRNLDEVWGGNPCFSPDGRFIVYEDYEPELSPAISVVSVDGRNRQVLVRDAWEPAW